jgi:hypothetical protein
MRTLGYTLDQISTEIGWNSPSTAFRAIMRAMERRERENVDALRSLENDRLDEVFRSAATVFFRPPPLLYKGRPVVVSRTRPDGTVVAEEQVDVTAKMRAGDLMIKVFERRARLNGLDAAEKYELTGADGGPVPVEVEVSAAKVLEQIQSIRDRSSTAGLALLPGTGVFPTGRGAAVGDEPDEPDEPEGVAR